MTTPEDPKPVKAPRRKKARARPAPGPAEPPAPGPQPTSRKGGVATIGILGVVLIIGRILWAGARPPSQSNDQSVAAALGSPEFKCKLECRTLVSPLGSKAEPDPAELDACNRACQSAKADEPAANLVSSASTCRKSCVAAHSAATSATGEDGGPPPANRMRWASPYDCLGRCSVAAVRGQDFDPATGAMTTPVPVPASYQ